MWTESTVLNSHCVRKGRYGEKDKSYLSLYTWNSKITSDVAEGKEKTDVGENPASPCQSPNCSVRNLQLHLSLFRRQVLTTSPSSDQSWCYLKSVDLVSNYSNSSHLPFVGRCPWLIFTSLVTHEELLLSLNSCLPFCIATEISTLCLWVIVEKPKTDCSCQVL